MEKVQPWEITPEKLYLNRRKFMVGAGVATSAALLAACSMPEPLPGETAGDSASVPVSREFPVDDVPAALANSEPFASMAEDELGNALNSFEQITNYNNFYEFSLGKEQVNPLSSEFNPYPWTVEVTGLVNNPRTFSLEDMVTNFAQEERIYRLRCVEAWSMVIPWVGFELGAMLREVDPTSEAKYVRFETVVRPEEMPGQRSRSLDWPYVEGLRLDEAMHPLTIMATGMYGKPLTNPNGAPIRLVVPWKYGFKSIKSIVKIELTDEMPVSTWMSQAPREYGFYANVNPEVDHPRWSQATERVIGGGLSGGRKDTLMFNGYGDEVASLYEGMDLAENF